MMFQRLLQRSQSRIVGHRQEVRIYEVSSESTVEASPSIGSVDRGQRSSRGCRPLRSAPVPVDQEPWLARYYQSSFHQGPGCSQARIAPEPPHPFDLRYGTDTGGYTSSAELHGNTLSSLYTTAYWGIAPSAFSSALSSLKINFGEFTFVDVGCGKGRAILVAAQFPFRGLFGVEIDPELCVIARANLTLRPELADRASIVNEDAVSVTYPDGPLVIFMFHPFLAPVLRRVLANLEKQLRDSPRTTYLTVCSQSALHTRAGKISISAGGIRNGASALARRRRSRSLSPYP